MKIMQIKKNDNGNNISKNKKYLDFQYNLK